MPRAVDWVPHRAVLGGEPLPQRRRPSLAVAALVLVALALPTFAACAAAAVGPPRERVRAALAAGARHAPALLGRPDVVGTGVGLGADGQPVLRVFTTGPGEARAPAPALPTRLDGFRVEARVTGRVFALRGPTCEASGDSVCQSTERWPLPVPIGTSVGHPSITAGTIGARVSDGSQLFALSNNHVLANSNVASPGDAALQPGPVDGGSLGAGDAIGALFDFEPIVFCIVDFLTVICPETNDFDAAIAATTSGELGVATPEGEFGSVAGYGAPNPLIHAAYGTLGVSGDEDLPQLLGAAVQKYGRTTAHTAGVVDTIGMTLDVCYDPFCSLVARFEDQLAVSGAFSAGGDSGSLVVTDDAARRPVGLLFAGSETQTILSRIDLVLERFDVVVDDAGLVGPVVDAALQALDPPSFGLVGETSEVRVVVRNAGTEPLPAVGVELADETEGTTTTLLAPALAAGASAELFFDWTPLLVGPHTLSAALVPPGGDDDPDNDAASAPVTVYAEAPGVSLALWKGTARTDAWTQVALPHDYGSDMVPVCTPVYTEVGLGPLIARVRNAEGSGFEVGLGRPWFLAFPGEETTGEVQCMVVRAGVYDEPGYRLEAHRLAGFASTDGGGAWGGQAAAYAQAYAQPVVVGQVVTASSAAPGDTASWTQFWARGATAFQAPSPAALFVGRHTGEDPGARAPETLAYVVLEAREGTLSGRRYVAGVGPETVRGMGDAPPYDYPLSSFLPTTTHAVASSAGMDGLEGGWPVLYGGAGAPPVEPGALHLAIEEDWYFDPERSHTTEQVAYVVFGRRPGCGLGYELALLLLFARHIGGRARTGSRREKSLSSMG